jgi:hypothetical protein
MPDDCIDIKPMKFLGNRDPRMSHRDLFCRRSPPTVDLRCSMSLSKKGPLRFKVRLG